MKQLIFILFILSIMSCGRENILEESTEFEEIIPEIEDTSSGVSFILSDIDSEFNIEGGRAYIREDINNQYGKKFIFEVIVTVQDNEESAFALLWAGDSIEPGQFDLEFGVLAFKEGDNEEYTLLFAEPIFGDESDIQITIDDVGGVGQRVIGGFVGNILNENKEFVKIEGKFNVLREE